jgi:hypothetical protein
MRYWTLAEATDALPRVRRRVQRIKELVREAQARARAVAGNGHGEGASSNGHGPSEHDRAAHELATLVQELQDEGIIVRDPARGLIDFPARSSSGADYLLCWLDGEDAIDWWHWPDAGFAGRTPITTPPD